MRLVHPCCVLALCLIGLPAAAAYAEPATKKGAEQLANNIARTFKQEKLPPQITITAEGDHYLLKVNFLAEEKIESDSSEKSTVDELRFNIFDQGDGQWHITMEQPFHLIDLTPLDRTQFSTERLVFDGFYDSHIHNFTTASLQAEKSDFYYVNFDTEDTTTIEAGQFTVDYQTVKQSANAFDIRLIPSVANLRIRNHFFDPVKVIDDDDLFQSGSAGMGLEVLGVRVVEIRALSKFFQAYPSDRQRQEHGLELKELLVKAEPFFEHLKFSFNLSDAIMMDKNVIVSVDEARYEDNFSGLISNASYEPTAHLKNFRIGSEQIADYLRPLIPQNFDAHYKLYGLDFSAPYKLFVSQADFTKQNPFPEENTMLPVALVGALIPEGAVRFDYDLSVASPLYHSTSRAKVTYHLFNLLGAGLSSVFTPLKNIELKIDTRLTGLDAIFAQLEKAPANRDVGSFIEFLVKAKELAVAEGQDTYDWHVQNKGETIMINGYNIDHNGNKMPVTPPAQP